MYSVGVFRSQALLTAPPAALGSRAPRMCLLPLFLCLVAPAWRAIVLSPSAWSRASTACDGPQTPRVWGKRTLPEVVLKHPRTLTPPRPGSLDLARFTVGRGSGWVPAARALPTGAEETREESGLPLMRFRDPYLHPLLQYAP